MSAPVDVLVVMRWAQVHLGHGLIVSMNLATAVEEARDAVAELIEACDAEYSAMGRHLARPTDDNREAYFDAMQRRRASLARVKGEPA